MSLGCATLGDSAADLAEFMPAAVKKHVQCEEHQSYPRVHVDAARYPGPASPGALILTETARAVGLVGELSNALSR